MMNTITLTPIESLLFLKDLAENWMLTSGDIHIYFKHDYWVRHKEKEYIPSTLELLNILNKNTFRLIPMP